MTCKSVGDANPDIAGTGILIAFIIQSLIAVIVSGYTWILSSAIQSRWDAADPEPRTRRIWDGATYLLGSKLKAWLEGIFSLIEALEETYLRCVFGHGQKRDDGIALSFNLVWLIGKQPEHSRKRNADSRIEDEITPTTRRLECANRILLAGSDSQTFTGIALLISALVQSKTLTFYHMHVIYDTISLVIISNCAASVCIFREGLVKGYIRLALMMIWMLLFLAYTIVFGRRLQHWDNDVSGYCYITTATSRQQDSHPQVDNIYVGLTCFFIFGSFNYAVMLSLNAQLKQAQKSLGITSSTVLFRAASSGLIGRRAASSQYLQAMIHLYSALLSSTMLGPATDLQYFILEIAMLQCPLHIYSIFALRSSNERFLQGGSERAWGFGQIAAVVLLGGNILQFVDGLIEEYHKTAVLDTVPSGDNEQSALNQSLVRDATQD